MFCGRFEVQKISLIYPIIINILIYSVNGCLFSGRFILPSVHYPDREAREPRSCRSVKEHHFLNSLVHRPEEFSSRPRHSAITIQSSSSFLSKVHFLPLGASLSANDDFECLRVNLIISVSLAQMDNAPNPSATKPSAAPALGKSGKKICCACPGAYYLCESTIWHFLCSEMSVQISV